MEITQHRISLWKEDALAAAALLFVWLAGPYAVLALERVLP